MKNCESTERLGQEVMSCNDVLTFKSKLDIRKQT